DYVVYVRKDLGEENIRKAFENLDRIKVLMPYRPSGHRLPKRFKEHKDISLESASQELLAAVLHESGKLADAEVATLHRAIEKGGVLFGVYDAPRFVLYVDKDTSREEVERMRTLLEEKEAGSDRAEIAVATTNG